MFSMMYGLKLKAERDIESITQHTSTRQQQAVEEISD
jgi:plasmid stabilization system protein ParE